MSEKKFTASEWLRYTRHLQLPQVGIEGQQRLKQAKVLIVGAGGLGSPVALYLAAAGVGEITVVDGDTVDLTNLQRQILFSTDQVGQAKAECARERLQALNSDIKVHAVNEHLSRTNVEQLFQGKGLILDCTDNFATRYLINDTCVQLKIPWVFASIFQFSGQCALFTPDSACFRCLFPETPQGLADCNTAGVLGVLPGLLGTLQANEALKFLTGLECPLENTLLLVEALDLSFRKIQLAKNKDCRVCGEGEPQIDPADYQWLCEAEVQSGLSLSAVELNDFADEESYQLIDVRTDAERSAFHIGGEHLPLATLNEAATDLDKDKLMICYCQTGVRSQSAAEQLVSWGFNAKSLQGGLVGYLKTNSLP